LTFILSVNLWTGLPLLALWVGSQATGGELLNMTGVVAVVLALAILETASVIALTRISAGYDRVTGRPAPVRQPPPGLLSMSASKAQPAGRREINAIEAIVIAVVVVAFMAFEVWFFFLATTSPMG
jgi:hypothetical protein